MVTARGVSRHRRARHDHPLLPAVRAVQRVHADHPRFWDDVRSSSTSRWSAMPSALSPRWPPSSRTAGGANLVTCGLLVTAVLVPVGLPNVPNKVTYLVLYAAVSLVEGMLLVATPALIRDFSPQLGRASAMGFWTLGPVIGGLVVTEVSSNTLGSHPHWQTQSDRPARARLTDCRCPPLGFLNGRAGGADH